MTEEEFKTKNGLNDEELQRTKSACKVLNGKITNLSETVKKWQEWENIRFNQ